MVIATVECKTYSKSELADLYQMGKDTFRRWCRSQGLDLGRKKVLNPTEVQALVLKLGPPTLTIQWPASTSPLAALPA